ncbi:MAG: OmpA family protein [Colwellia sp.]
MKIFKLSALALLASSVMMSSASFANEQPTGADLVGNAYGGLHLMHMRTDSDRLLDVAGFPSVDHASGAGAELGYRVTEALEFRLSYTHLNLVMDNRGFNEPDASSSVFDVLYFLNKQNFYFVAGANSLDIVDRKTSFDLGAGYRHYISDRAALYLEGKSHYQFSKDFVDYSARLGFIYFFGDNKKSTPVVAAAAVTTAAVAASTPVAQLMDSDKDGIADKFDLCADTPDLDKVDDKGCTIFTEETLTQDLFVEFDSNKSAIKPEYYAAIAAMAEFMQTYPHTNIEIAGHTSAVGAKEANRILSQKRADAIKDTLVNKYGIAVSRVSAVGYGEAKLINLANTAEANKENRRIEAVLEIKHKVAQKAAQ